MEPDRAPADQVGAGLHSLTVDEANRALRVLAAGRGAEPDLPPPAPPPVCSPAPPRRPRPPTPPRRPPSPRPPNPPRIGPDPPRSGCSAPSGSTSTAASSPRACAPKPPRLLAWLLVRWRHAVPLPRPAPGSAAPEVGRPRALPPRPRGSRQPGRRAWPAVRRAGHPGRHAAGGHRLPHQRGGVLPGDARLVLRLLRRPQPRQPGRRRVGTPHVSGVRPPGDRPLPVDRRRPTPPERRRHWRDGLRRGARFAADHPPKVPAGRLQRLLDQATVAVGEPRIVL